MTSAPLRRAFKYRFCPTEGQAAELSRTFGCVRKVDNLALAARTEVSAHDEPVGYAATSAMKKGSREAAEYTASAFRCRDGKLTLAKMTEPLAIVWSRPLPEGVVPSTVTVSQDGSGRWFVSLLCVDTAITPLPANGSAVDVGLEHLLTLSTGENIANPRHEHRDRVRLVKAQWSLARKAKGEGANRAKARRAVARIHARIADRRRDHLHQLTTRLVRDNQTLVIEDLAVPGLVRNRSPARAIGDAGWAEFRSMLEYKAAWYGRQVSTVDRFFPSSRMCSVGGAVTDTMPQAVRTWTCGCGAVHDRDVNAARNLLAAGLAVSVCGAGVRPQRLTPGGQSAVKQKPSRRER
jgi:putative transposase